jgi:protein-tyrosine phosphatase
MIEEKPYQALIENSIYLGGAADVERMVKEAGCEVIVDLRGEATECAYPSADVEWIRINIGDDSNDHLEERFAEAVASIVKAYEQGRKVGVHCNGGKGRTGAVAIGTLLALGKASSLEEAERMVKTVRPVIQVKPHQKDALVKLYQTKR